MPPIKSKEIKEIFIKLDKNNSGYIDYSCTHLDNL